MYVSAAAPWTVAARPSPPSPGWTIDETHPSRSRCPRTVVRAGRVRADHRKGRQRRNGGSASRGARGCSRTGQARRIAGRRSRGARARAGQARGIARGGPRGARSRGARAAPPATAPPAPAPLTPTTAPAGAAPAKAVDLGISPTTPALGGGTMISTQAGGEPHRDHERRRRRMEVRLPRLPARAVANQLRPSHARPAAEHLQPVRQRAPGYAQPRPAGGFVGPYPFGADGPPGTQWHSPTRVPGYLYTTWEYTNTVHGPWAQLNFTYGNSRAMATVIVDSYSQTDGGYKHLQAQQGIDQAFLTLNFPDALGDLGTLTWNISRRSRTATAPWASTTAACTRPTSSAEPTSPARR